MKQKRTLSIITGILFVLVAFLSLKSIFSKIQYTFYLSSGYSSLPYAILEIIGYTILAVALFRSKSKNVLLLIGLAVCTLANILMGRIWSTLSWVFAAAFATSILTDRIPNLTPIVKKLYFVPAVFMLIYAHGVYSIYSEIFIPTYAFMYTIPEFLEVAALWGLMAIRWAPVHKKEQHESNANAPAVASEFYYSLGKHVLLLLFTCGVWMYMWIYKTTRHTNAVKGEEYRNPTNKLLLCLFVPFYSIYWTYKTAQRIDKMANEKGITSDISTLCLILAIFVPIIPPILLQDKLNVIATTNTSHVDKSKSALEYGVTDELRNYKELLDGGVISQEEFDAKKKQLLGL